MRNLRSFIAMILLVSLLLVFFYSSLHLEMTHSHRAAINKKPTEGPLSIQDQVQVQVQDQVQNQVQVRESITVPHLEVQNISDSFKQAIPQNGAYWNRLLYSALKNQGIGGNSSRRDSDWSSCKVVHQEVLRLNVHDFNLYNFLFQDFVQGMGCRTPPVLINVPKKCVSAGGDKNGEKLLLFAIKSTPGHFERRQAVRETWGEEGVKQSGLRVRTVFLMGSHQADDPDLSPLLSFESQLFGDILQWDFQESFLNLTLKMNVLLQWTLQHCAHVNFVFSGDDDVFVNTPLLLSYLQSLDSTKASKLYSGHVISTASPIRDPKSKYYIPLSFYDGPYPAYVGGGGLLISGALLRPLYSVSHVIPFYPIDDVYTGMCFKAIGVSPEIHPGFHTFDLKEADRENVCVHKDLILIHKRSPQEIKRLWRGIHSPFLTC
ncbi:N-acetyllactosaminide beta-1%2C3-N-acetylglucosaminyltransferase 2 [Xyrichtys novacula]|uniref:Hexosyltransferase n=1 Tax=Xyrichtys novacula TaxID=13765 RepID=A0AAV1FUT8_XYRNO|nr:N-acetyllactosaminide beta-1%2C3-N-acetylglucosaminyltransferase 2 [Xyrichtys novacula]